MAGGDSGNEPYNFLPGRDLNFRVAQLKVKESSTNGPFQTSFKFESLKFSKLESGSLPPVEIYDEKF